MEKQDIYQAATTPIRFVQDKTNFAVMAQNALGLAMPPVIPVKWNPVVPKANGEITQSTGFEAGDYMFQCPTVLSVEGNDFYLPFDPVISVNCKNIITRRYVAKGRTSTSIKEFWSKDDYRISVAGVILANDANELTQYIANLREVLEYSGSGKIVNEILNKAYKINHIAIEDYNFPFTKGMENQTFSFNAYADDSIYLLEG